MKKHINNKVYDTDTAKLIGKSETDEIEFALYKKRTAEYFLVNQQKGIENAVPTFVPLKYDEAKTFAEKHFKAEYDAEFQNKENGLNVLSVSVSAQTREKLDTIRAMKKKSISAIITEMIDKESTINTIFEENGIYFEDIKECQFCVETDNENDIAFYTDSFINAIKEYTTLCSYLDSDCDDSEDIEYSNVYLELYIVEGNTGHTIYLDKAR